MHSPRLAASLQWTLAVNRNMANGLSTASWTSIAKSNDEIQTRHYF